MSFVSVVYFQADSVSETSCLLVQKSTIDCGGLFCVIYEGWNFNSGNYLFTTDTK